MNSKYYQNSITIHKDYAGKEYAKRSCFRDLLDEAIEKEVKIGHPPLVLAIVGHSAELPDPWRSGGTQISAALEVMGTLVNSERMIHQSYRRSQGDLRSPRPAFIPEPAIDIVSTPGRRVYVRSDVDVPIPTYIRPMLDILEEGGYHNAAEFLYDFLKKQGAVD